MEKIAIVGGGAAGMTCAVLLARKGYDVIVLERGERLGRKLSATGNGQGNLTNVNMGAEHYFSGDRNKVARALARFGAEDTVRFFGSMGGIYLPDARGRVYPAGRQASAATDLFRRELSRLGSGICFGAQVREIAYDGEFTLAWSGGHMRADKVVLAAGGCAAPNFGTDGSAFSLAKSLGHTVTELSPVLVQLRTDPATVRGLKGIRTDARLRVFRKGNCLFDGRGDVLFTESGLSGDCVFRASSYAEKGDAISVDFLPDVPEQALADAVERGDGLLCVVNNGLARVLEKRAGNDRAALCALVKNFTLTVTGTLGFGYAQATRGGVPLCEVDDDLMSVKRRGLYFAGEMLDVDGECGGYNLQWAFTSAFVAAEGISKCC